MLVSVSVRCCLYSGESNVVHNKVLYNYGLYTYSYTKPLIKTEVTSCWNIIIIQYNYDSVKNVHYRVLVFSVFCNSTLVV